MRVDHDSRDGDIEAMRVAVERFFHVAGAATLKLPTGWFGRPMDNQHELTRTSVNSNCLEIELDGTQRLNFEWPVSLEVNARVLKITGFRRLEWRWTEYGGGATRLQTFGEGSVELHSC